MNEYYVQPNLFKSNKIHDIENIQRPNILLPIGDYKKGYETINYTYLIKNVNKTIIIGEPGCGKSRLLLEIKNQSANLNKKCYTILLKDINENDSIKSLLNLQDLEHLEDIIICLDALDEVKPHLFSDVVSKIKLLALEMNKSSILVTCRMHYIKMNQHIINQLKFDYTKISPFTDNQIHEFLKENIINNDELINKILRITRDRNDQSILAIPRYLKEICEYLTLYNLSDKDISALRRHDFLELAIYKKLDHEAIEKGTKKDNEKYIVQRVLEKLALIMEIYKTNQIHIDELITFFDDVNSNLNLIFLKEIDIDIFIERQLKKTDNIIEFDNTEFQEYLAAKELLRLGSKNQLLYELILHKEFEHIYPNWYDVLRYVVEIDAMQILPIINLLNQKKGGLVIDSYFELLDYLDVNQLNTIQKAFIFKTILDYYQKNGLWIHYNLHRIIDLYQEANYEYFFEEIIEIDESNKTQLVNQIHVIENLIDLKKLDDMKIEYWQQSLKELIVKNTDILIQNACIYALTSINKLICFEEIKDIVLNKSDELDNSFYRAIAKIDPNSEFTFNLLLKGMKEGKHDALYGLQNVTDADKLLRLLVILIDNETEYVNFLKEKELLPLNYATLFGNISVVIDSKECNIYRKTFELFLKVLNDETNYFHYQNKEFVEECFYALNKCNKDLIFDLIDVLPKDIFFYEFTNVICKFITYETIEKLSNKFIEKYGDNKSLHYIFRRIRSTNNPQSDLIYELRLKYFKEEYSISAKTVDINEENNDLAIYEKFKYELEPRKDVYYLQVFETYLKNRDIIDNFLHENEKKRLINIIIKILENNNPKDSVVTIRDITNDSREISMNRFFMFFPKIFKIAYLLNMKSDLLPYRQNLISFLPILSINDSEHSINIDEFFILVDGLTEIDIDFLLEFCLNRTDDFLYVSTTSFIRLINEKKINNLIPLVRRLANDNRLKLHEKLEALDCLGDPLFQVEKEFFKTKFNNQIEDNKDNWNLKNKLSQILVTNYKDVDSIEWRIEHIKKKVFAYEESFHVGIHYVSDRELELEKPIFARCIIEIGEPSLIPLFLDLLKVSFEIRREIIYWRYSDYIQTIVFEYFNYLNSIVYLNHVKSYLKSNGSLSYTSSFDKHIRNLEINLIENLKPSNINICINTYNSLKKAILLPIYNNLDLSYHFEKAILELKNVIENEGLYKTIQDLAKSKTNDKISYSNINEGIIQKTLKVQLENILLKSGIRETDIHREVELYDGKRTDFLIKYGFIGPVMVEIKLLHNPEILYESNRLKYKEKLRQYIAATNSQYSFYLIFEIRNGKKYENHKKSFSKMKDEYKDISNLGIHLISCTGRIN